MDIAALDSRFKSDPGRVFLEIIQSARQPLRAQEIKQHLIDAGVRKVDVDRQWTRFQRVLKLHPRISLVKTRYEWSADDRPPEESLAVLAANLLARVPSWLSQALVQSVTDALAKPSVAESGWSAREFELASLVAELAVAVDVLQARGDTITEVTRLFADETRRKRLWRIGASGETVAFDIEEHESEAGVPEPGASVRIVRPGYIWRGGGEPIVAAKAVVTP